MDCTAVLDDETIERLLNACSEIYNSLKRRKQSYFRGSHILYGVLMALHNYSGLVARKCVLT